MNKGTAKVLGPKLLNSSLLIYIYLYYNIHHCSPFIDSRINQPKQKASVKERLSENNLEAQAAFWNRCQRDSVEAYCMDLQNK
jgi:hypothetical protein